MNTSFNELLANNKKVRIELKLTEASKQRVNECIDKNIFYGVFPIKGNSMECEDKNKCIPNGSKVLAIDTQIKLSNGISNIWHEIPTNKTLLISGKNSTGKHFFICKSIASVDAVQGYILLDSYNKTHGSKWIPFKWIENVFEVLQIVD
jgi:hypothetical protein